MSKKEVLEKIKIQKAMFKKYRPDDFLKQVEYDIACDILHALDDDIIDYDEVINIFINAEAKAKKLIKFY